MKPLDPTIKSWTDKIYNVDKIKYRDLIKWVRAAERTYTVEDIAYALGQFYERAYTVGPKWWPYLDRILDKVEGQNNARQSEAQHYENIQAEKDWARTFKANS